MPSIFNNFYKSKMNTKYIDLINQTFDFPQSEFALENNKLFFS